ncbi:MAG: hypothetical protein J6C64_03680 [Lachnospiraceae bacterium]|nr:hypothetical protein [Lachnospiraceae bacterium]
MTGMKWKSAFLSLMIMGLLGTCACQKEVVTVADIQSDEEAGKYIEMKEFELKETEEESGREEVQYCVVLIPEGYHESEQIPGMYLHERTPLDSSNIYYTVSEGKNGGQVSDSLTEKAYKETIEKAFQEKGQDVELEIDSFEELSMDGIPAYKIRSCYETDGNRIQQLTYLVLAENTYTITYSQSEDDELLADFEISDGEIKLVKEDSVEMAVKN